MTESGMRYFTLNPLHKAWRICVELISFWIHSFTRKILCWNLVRSSDSLMYWAGSEPARLIQTKPNCSKISWMCSFFQRLGVWNVCRKSAPQSSFSSGVTRKTRRNKGFLFLLSFIGRLEKLYLQLFYYHQIFIFYYNFPSKGYRNDLAWVWCVWSQLITLPTSSLKAALKEKMIPLLNQSEKGKEQTKESFWHKRPGNKGVKCQNNVRTSNSWWMIRKW